MITFELVGINIIVLAALIYSVLFWAGKLIKKELKFLDGIGASLIGGVLLLIMMFLHEGCHAIVANARGVAVYGIELRIGGMSTDVGGVANLPRDVALPILAAGPMLDVFFLVLMFVGVYKTKGILRLAFVGVILTIMMTLGGFPLNPNSDLYRIFIGIK